MDRALSRTTRLVVALAFGSLLSASATAGGLTDLLMSKVGVSQPQAVGGAGSVFQLAKSQMTTANFAKLSGAVPDMGQYLGAAPTLAPTTANASGGSALAGAAAKALGGSGALGTQAADMGGKLATLQQLAPAFEQLGMKQKMVGKFVPVIVDYVKQQGGASTAKLLTGALGF